ncbi:MAG TPA: helix-turn-helix domain-containing GNAT family N-acetyltransferase [Candidatus Sulfotelmatobacter sp.]
MATIIIAFSNYIGYLADMSFPAIAGCEPEISDVRHFNRFYTRQLGLLDESLLSSPFSLSQARTLYELSRRKDFTAVELCREMGLDPGYLSRLLSGLEKEGVIEKKRSPSDARHIFLRLTKKGLKAFEHLNAGSAEQVRSLLSRLLPEEKRKLIQAMHTIEAVLSEKENRGPGFVLRQPWSGDLGWIVLRHGVLYRQEYGYDERFEALVARIVAEFVATFNPSRERCWIAEKDGENVGSVLLVRKSQNVAKLRLLLVEPAARGLGIGRYLISECVRFARESGYKKIMLWTQSELVAARALYQKAGFELVAQEAHQSWGRKDLVAETWQLKL